MEKTFAPQINPIFTEFNQTVEDYKKSDGTHVDFDLYLQGKDLLFDLCSKHEIDQRHYRINPFAILHR